MTKPLMNVTQCQHGEYACTLCDRPVAEIPTIDIVQLTEMFGESADQQSAVAAWTGESDIWINGTDGLEPNPRWTAAEAAELLRIWQRGMQASKR